MLNKKTKILKNKKAFTLIEILIIVLILGLLVSIILVSINSARTKAKNNSFKTTVKSIQTGIEFCCSAGTIALFDTPGGDICTGGGKYPGPDSVSSISVGDCINNVFDKTIEPGTKNSGDCIRARITQNGVSYEGC